MPRPPKTISHINGVKHWNCYMCMQILPESDYPKCGQKPHASYCKKCCCARSKSTYVPRERKPYKNIVPNESDHDILKALQGFDPSWTMEGLNRAKTQVMQ